MTSGVSGGASSKVNVVAVVRERPIAGEGGADAGVLRGYLLDGMSA